MSLAALLRFYMLGEWSFWIDEIYSLQSAKIARETDRFLPLSSYLAGGVIHLIGTNEWSARLVSVLTGLLTLPLLYFPIKKAYGLRVALLSTIFLAISPWHLYWSQNMRFYTMLLLLYMLLLFRFYRVTEHRKSWYDLIFLFVLLIFAVYERFIAFFIVPVAICYILSRQLGSFGAASQLRLAKILPLFLVPVGGLVIHELSRTAAGHDPVILSFFLKFVGAPNTSPLRFLASFVYRAGIPVLGLGLAGSFFVLTKKDRLGLLLVISALLPPTLLFLASPIVFTIDRYAFISLPSWLVLAAIAIDQALSQKAQYGWIFGLAMLFVVVSDGLTQDMLYYQYYNGGRENWKGAFAVIQEQHAPDDLVFASRPELGEYYLKEDVNPLNRGLPEEIQRRNQRTWIVVSTSTGYVAPSVLAWIENSCVLIEVLDVHVPGKVYDLRVYLYSPDDSQRAGFRYESGGKVSSTLRETAFSLMYTKLTR